MCDCPPSETARSSPSSCRNTTNIEAVWIVAVACPANILALTEEIPSHLDGDQNFGTPPRPSLSSVPFAPTRWRNEGGQIGRQYFGAPMTPMIWQGGPGQEPNSPIFKPPSRVWPSARATAEAEAAAAARAAAAATRGTPSATSSGGGLERCRQNSSLLVRIALSSPLIPLQTRIGLQSTSLWRRNAARGSILMFS